MSGLAISFLADEVARDPTQGLAEYEATLASALGELGLVAADPTRAVGVARRVGLVQGQPVDIVDLWGGRGEVGKGARRKRAADLQRWRWPARA